MGPSGIFFGFHRASRRHRVGRFALCALGYSAKGVGYFFTKGVGLFVELSEAVEFGEVFDSNYSFTHSSTCIGGNASLNNTRNQDCMIYK